jgi:cytochrome c biogenesis protein CcdA
MMDVLLLPALLGALISVGFCAARVSSKRRPSFRIALLIAFAMGIAFTLVTFGLSLFTSRFWADNAGFDPVIAGVSLIFGAFGLAGFVPAFLVVVLYRISYVK